MLFDLRGRRRRAVQATYLTLAVLMGGGLVFFGIGGDVSGGLFDAFSERGGGGNGNSLLEERIDRNEKLVRTRPDSERALAALVRDYYQLAGTESDPSQAGFSQDARDELRKAGASWKRYLEAAENPSPSLASVAIQLYAPTALNKPKDGQKAAAIVAEEQNSPAAYIQLVQYATLAGDTRTADLAGQKAIDLAPKAERQAVKDQVKQAKTPLPPQTSGG